MNQIKNLPEFECCKSCRSHQHGSILTSAVTKRAVLDSALASFFRCTCQNFLRAIDYQGRSLIHMTASRGRLPLLEWLLNHIPANQQGIDIKDLKDAESGYTALHRSIFYGQIHVAVALIKLGANMSILDNEDMSPLDLAIVDRHPRVELSKELPCEAYSWGANTNYTLGTSLQHQRNYPELLTSFTKQNVFIKQICLSKFHSIFISSDGTAWSCGHGEGGRLGIATRDTRVLPTPISLSESCIQAAVGRDHTLLLMQSGIILSCGINDFHQLGQMPPPAFQLSPKPVKLRLSGILGICAARYHSAAYNARTLYTWGLNGGQLGHPKEQDKTITIPKKVLYFGNSPDDCTIECVAVSDGATTVTTSKGDIYVINQFHCRRIASRLHNIKYVRVIGGEVIGGDKLTEQQKIVSVLMLNTVGNMFLWQDTNNQFMRCIFNTNRPLFVNEAILSRENILFTTKSGEAFHGNIMPRKITTSKPRTESVDDYTLSPKDKTNSNKSFHNFIDKDECYLIKLKKIPNIHRAVNIYCDAKANNFAILQVIPNAHLIEIPQVTTSQMRNDFTELLDQASEFDLLHDVILQVDRMKYPAHRYILAHGSDYFANLFLNHEAENNGQESESKIPTFKIENTHPAIFKQILLYLYTGTCDLMIPGPCKIEIETSDNKLNEMINDDLELYLDKSAFEVHKKNEKNKSNKNGLKKNKNENKTIHDPVRLLQAAAKKFSINSLYKILDVYGCDGNKIVIRYIDRKVERTKYGFDKNILNEFCDANIKCSDGAIIKAHKCILAARLEYFNGMFCHTWAETTKFSTISLHIKEKMLNPIINFLYTDCCPELDECEDFDFIGNMLVLCDQLFITRMREMCEAALSNMLTLKNVPDILQIADTFNCTQLKVSCMEYISLNISSIIENRSLENTHSKLLEDLTRYYATFNPIMSQRIITPFSDAPSDEVIMSCSEVFPTDVIENIDEETLKEIEKDFTPSLNKKRSKVRKTSHSEDDKTPKKPVTPVMPTNIQSINKSIDTIPKEASNTQLSDDWTQVSNSGSKQQKVLRARLKAITTVKENFDILESAVTFTKLVKKNENDDRISSSIRSPVKNGTYEYDDIEESVNRSPMTVLNVTIVNKKLSQKQRKRLSFENGEMGSSFEQPLKIDETPCCIVPKNPWKKVEATPTVNIVDSKLNFADILVDQKKQKENLSKMMTKSLVLTQIEDRAISELTKRYASAAEDEERISVRRVIGGTVASPQWIKN